jgi:uncharacterized protein (UPF0276 family)
MRFGAGFHPGWLADDPTTRLDLPPGVALIEGGVREVNNWFTQSAHPHAEFSLHLARSPITDPPDEHQAFIQHIARGVSELPVCSVGLHLSGPRSSGIGVLGMSSHYSASPELEARAIRFVECLRREVQYPIWLENANYYSVSADEVVRNWESFSLIVEATGASVIADLTHLYIEAKNLGLTPAALLGLVPWRRVTEVHLAGFVSGKDGALHDGHSQPVSPEIWELLELALTHFPLDTNGLTITVEHTDLVWGRKRDAYGEDFARARELVAAVQTRTADSRAASAMQYGLGYVQHLLVQRIPQLDVAVCQQGWELRSLIEAWVLEVTKSLGHRITLSMAEVPPEEQALTEELAPSFLNFLKRKAAHADRD